MENAERGAICTQVSQGQLAPSRGLGFIASIPLLITEAPTARSGSRSSLLLGGGSVVALWRLGGQRAALEGVREAAVHTVRGRAGWSPHSGSMHQLSRAGMLSLYGGGGETSPSSGGTPPEEARSA